MLNKHMPNGHNGHNGHRSGGKKKRSRLILGLPMPVALVYAVLFVAAFVLYNFLWKDAPKLAADSGGYMRAAQDLKDFSPDQLQIRPAGYPLLLILTGSAEKPTHLLFFAQMIIHFAAVWLLALVLYTTGVSRILLYVFGGVLVLPPYMEATGYVLSEALAEFLLAVALAGLILWYQHRNNKWLVAASVALGVSAITRPANQALAFMLAGALLLMPLLVGHIRMRYRTVRRASLILVIGTIAIVTVYSLMNFAKFGYPGVTPLLGYNLSTRTVRFIERLPEKGKYAEVRAALIKIRDEHLVQPNSSHTGYQYIWDAQPELEKITGLKDPQLSNYLTQMNLTLISKAPMEYLQDVAWAAGSYWFPSTRGLANMNSTIVQLGWAALHFVFLGFFTLQLFLFMGIELFKKSRGFVARRHGHKWTEPEFGLRSVQVMAYVFAGIMVFYTMALTCFLDVGQPRQRTSTEAIFIFMVFLGALLMSVRFICVR